MSGPPARVEGVASNLAGSETAREQPGNAPIAAVGASAGGLDALKRLVGALPADTTLALVVIQHLSASHESLLTAALGAASPLPVVEVRDEMPVRPGRVHVIPPNATLELSGGLLRLHGRSESAPPPMPVDGFMKSLAAERKAEAIGIVLSGTGSDGTLGLRAIRTAGGRTYAQDPSSAAHDGMPRSAIAANAVDLILRPEEIAADLAALARGTTAPSDREPRAEDALKQAVAEARLARDFAAAAMQTAPVPVAVLDDTLRITSANRAFHEVFLSTPASAEGRSIEDLGTGQWHTKELAALLRGALEREVALDEVEVERDFPGAGRRTMLLSGRAIVEGSTGRSSALVVAFQDVTERRRAEEERARTRSEETQRFLNEVGAVLLPESLDYYSALSKLAALVVPRLADWCIVDLVEDGDRILQAAAAHVDSSKQPLGREMSRRFPADAEQDRGVGYVIRTGNAVIQPDVDDPAGLAGALGVEHPRLLRELGARSYIAAPLRGRRGVIGAISLVRSLPGGPRYGAEDLAVAEGLGQRAGLVVENARLYRAARDAVVARDDFLAIAAHELRTPLTTLQLHLQSLSGSHEVTAPIVGKLDRAILQTRRLAKLIDNLLEVSRITAGRLKLQRDAVDLAAITSDVAERLRSMASSAGCTLIVDAREPVTGMWDALRIEQIVTNLVQNAIRYAPGHPIEISVGGNDERARLIVRDHGPGIPADARRRVFERFEKAGIAAQTGLGLGLFITRQIVEAHGGVIRVADEDATGATLIVELPRGGPIPGGSSS